jgi:flagellar basal-body rod protein FlgC
MSFVNSLKVNASALAAERIRMNVISSNIANANSTRTEDGEGPYKRKDVIFTARNSGERFEDLMRLCIDPTIKEVKVDGIIEDVKPPRRVYNPAHPDADLEGYIALPNISVVEEMVNMITSTRSFESNVETINATKSMAQTAIQIGRA